MDIAVDLRVLLTGILLPLMLGALWAWARPVAAVATNALAEEEALGAIFANAPVAVLWLGSDGTVLMANGAARALLGMDAVTRQLPAAAWRARLLEDVQAVTSNATTSGRSRTVALEEGGEAVPRGAVMPRTWHWWVAAWQGGALVFVDDVTSAQQAEQATHLLLSDLAHELRTPLATLATHLEVLRLATIAPEVREQSVQFLRDETQRLVRLVNNTLELGRLASSSGLERRPVQLYPLVEAVVAQLYGEAQAKQVEVSVQAETNLPAILGNADRLKQVLLNLVDNGIKYARMGDRVWVTLAVEAGGVACAVCDSGPGIAPEHLPHVTRRFYRAVPSGIPGSGLGLALAAEIVRQHGAQLQVESISDNTDDSIGNNTGTCVRFVLPAWHEGDTA